MRADRSLFSNERGSGRLGQNRILRGRRAEAKPGRKPPSWSDQKAVRNQRLLGALPAASPGPGVPAFPWGGASGPSPPYAHARLTSCPPPCRHPPPTPEPLLSSEPQTPACTPDTSRLRGDATVCEWAGHCATDTRGDDSPGVHQPMGGTRETWAEHPTPVPSSQASCLMASTDGLTGGAPGWLGCT